MVGAPANGHHRLVNTVLRDGEARSVDPTAVVLGDWLVLLLRFVLILDRLLRVNAGFND